MARQDKRRGGEPYGPDARGLVTYLRRQASNALSWEGEVQIKGWIRWVLAARRAIERAGK